MDIIVAGIIFIGVIILANVLERRAKDQDRLLFTLFLLLLNSPFLLLGLVLIVVPDDTFSRVATDAGLNIRDGAAFGMVLFLMGAWGVGACLPPVRRVLARFLPFKADSLVHMLALFLIGYLIGQGGLALSQGGLEGLADIAQPTSVFLVAASQLIFALLGLLGVGLLVRRSGRAVAERLGLQNPKPVHWLVGLGWIGVLVIAQMIFGLLWAIVNPEQSQTLESINTLLLAEFDTVWEWLLLAVAAGVGEELLFRGALQPVFGLPATSVIFALIHVQYGLTPFTVFVALLALILGLIRRYYSTTIAIFIHVGYNFALGLLALLATYLEQIMA